jgi:hypothetical protein
VRLAGYLFSRIFSYPVKSKYRMCRCFDLEERVIEPKQN